MIAGITHDVVIHMDTIQQVGLIARPGTYRVTKPPAFIPRFSVGDPKGIDFSRWRSFVQDDFSGGAGQYRWSGTSGNNRYAESLFVDLGLPGTFAGSPINQENSDIARDILGPIQVQDPKSGAGFVVPAVMPTSVSAVTSIATLFSTVYPINLVSMSGSPILLHGKTALVFTNLPAIYGLQPLPQKTHVVKGGLDVVSGQPGDPLFGVWATLITTLPFPTLSAINFSNGILTADGLGVRLYNSTNGIGKSYWSTPAYSTNADSLINFDSKFWRTQENKLSFFDPSLSAWSTFYEIGEATSDILNAVPFNGKILLGKNNGLWAYDAGRTYIVQDFINAKDLSNFALMKVLKGDMYFNIGRQLMRLSSGNNFEKLDIPQVQGTIIGGTVTEDNLYYQIQDVNQVVRVFIFNPESGGAREWFRGRDISYQVGLATQIPQTLQALNGTLWMAPMFMTTAGSTQSSIAAVSLHLPPDVQVVPNFHRGGRSFLITSELDFGLPELDKLFDSIEVGYNLRSLKDAIDVYYLTNFIPSTSVLAVLTGAQVSHPELFDGSADTVVNVSNFSSLGPNNGIAICFSQPVSGFMLNAKGQGVRNVQVLYSNGATFVDDGSNGNPFSIDRQNPAGDMLVTPPFNDGATERILSSGQVFTWRPGHPLNWAPMLYQGVTGYWIVMTSQDVNIGYTGITQVTPLNLNTGLVRLETAPGWGFLGTIADNTLSLLSLNFPPDLISKHITLKFVFRSGGSSRPELQRLKLRWMPIGPDPEKIQVQMTALAINGLETIQPTVVENSAAFISKSLFSMDGAGKTYIVQLPYPHPVGHTRRMTVHLDSPGITPHLLTYAHTMGGIGANIEAEIPIILTEM